MQHKESIIEVYFSNEYGLFKMINGNRQLNESKINRIIREIEDGNDMLKYYPIQVKENNGRLEILDGQHRFYICKHLKRPVYYILVKEPKTMHEVAKININQEKWTNNDFINCYVQQNNPNYEELQKFLDAYGINIGTSTRLLQLGNPGSEGTNDKLVDTFRSGAFEVKFKDEAYAIADDCKRFEAYKNWRDRGFIIAIHKIRKAALVSIEDIATAFTAKPDMLTKQLNYKEYIYTLEKIFNVGKQKRITII